MNTVGEPVSISLNGVDNVGKSTQLAWLGRGLTGAHVAGAVDRWDARWQQVAAEDFSRWWFTDSTTAEHVGLLMDSHVARRRGSAELALEDRGLPMLCAAGAATAMVKDGLSAPAVLNVVDRLCVEIAVPQRREVRILLRRCTDPQQEATAALERQPAPVSDMYRAYQHALAEVVALQVQREDYEAVLTIGDDPILSIQARLRDTVAAAGVPTERLVGDAVDRLWVLAGMSESGKSAVGELLRSEHRVTRLKIGYLLEIAAAREGFENPYQWSAQAQAENLTEEVLRYAVDNKARCISVESAHRLDSTEHLQRIWGARCQAVFVDANDQLRRRRTKESDGAFAARDTTKYQRGADLIRGIADHVIDNTSTLGALKLSVARLVSAVDLPRSEPPIEDVAVTSRRWLVEAVAALHDEQVALVMATGSTGTPRWREHWSDLDLLVVRDTISSGWLAGTALKHPHGVKVAVSAFTVGDVEALRVPPRVLHALRRAHQGAGVLYRRADYRFPITAEDQIDRAGRGDLGLVLMTTRRLLAARPLDVRALHKHRILLMKILLRADAHAVDEYDDAVVAAFHRGHIHLSNEVPSLSEIVERRTEPDIAELLAQSITQLLGYIDGLDHSAGSRP